MEMVAKQLIRQKVLDYLSRETSPVGIGTIASNVRNENQLSQVRDSEVRNIVQSMIVTGKLDYAPGLKIELRKTAAKEL